MSLDPNDYTIDALEDELEHIDDPDELRTILEEERWGMDRVDAAMVIEDRLAEVADGSRREAGATGTEAGPAEQPDGGTAGATEADPAGADASHAEPAPSAGGVGMTGGFRDALDWRSAVIGFVAAAALFSLPSFLDHYLYFMTGQVNQVVIRQRWDLVALNVGGFLLFLIPLTYRRKADWKSMGVYTAFIVSLFVEMYGVPLTIYLSSATLVQPGSRAPPEYLLEFQLLGQSFGMDLWTLVGAVVTVVGMAIVAIGWVTIYRATERDDLVTGGIYRFSRHPQYVGIALIAFGWFIGWPTFLTTVIFPVLIYFYYKAAQNEEREVMEQLDDPTAYQEYRRDTPMFL